MPGRTKAIFAALLVIGCVHAAPRPSPAISEDAPYLMVLGIAQDGGFPQAGCNREHCEPLWENPSARRHVASLAIIDPQSGERWLIDATPDFREQLRMLDREIPSASSQLLSGIFLTHAHVGHYAGLINLGREILGARGIPVHGMPRMRRFLESNGPWDQLVRLGNISLRPLEDGVTVRLNDRIRVTPIVVPHRDEYSETVGFVIEGGGRSAFYLPDIDKWERWSTPIEQVLARVDVAWLDGTFHRDGEIAGRSMAEIPHPFIEETLRRFATLPAKERAKVRFIHLNHTNPAMKAGSEARREIERAGCRVAEQGERFPLAQ
ncbi:MAG TPA: MBL fold metallo-hydrolase [Thermoanaerobaculia bacterium]|nr:MBL fold metallo-hydrolase [Thermoanaerobaculia bacterium]